MGFLDNNGVERLVQDLREEFIEPSEIGDGLEYDGDLHLTSLTKSSTGEVYGPLSEVHADGWAEQFSTTGKNLISAEIQAFFSGTSDVASGYAINRANSMRSYLAEVSPNATYTLSAMGGNRLIIGIVDSLNPTTCLRAIMNETNAGIVNQTFATQADEHYVMAYLTNDASTEPVEWAQLELGSTATEYEPYTGGAPSPSPDYPQEIRVARGRNLLDPSLFDLVTLSNGLVKSIMPDNSILITGTATSAWAMLTDDYAYELDADTYTFTISKVLNHNVYIGFNFDDGTTSSNIPISAGSTSVSITASKKVTSVRIGISGFTAGTVFNETFGVQLTLGSIPQPYVPYGHVGLEVQGKNLLPVTATSQTIRNVELTIGADGSITAKGTPSSAFVYIYGQATLSAGTYVLSGCPSGGSYSSYVLRIEKQSDNSLVALDTGNGAQFTLSESLNVFARIYVYATIDKTFYPMLRLASDTDDTYQPYFHTTTPIPLPSKGWAGALTDAKDSLAIDSAGGYEWELATEMPTFDETVDSVGTNGSFFWIQRSNVSDVTLNGNNSRCSHLMYGVTNGRYANVTSLIRIYLDIEKTVESFRSWLSIHNLTFLFPLATPTTESGYITLPDIPSDATVSIPELENLGVRFWIDKSGSIKATLDAYKSRISNERAEDLSLVEDAVVELAADTLPKTKYYFGYDKVGNRNMLSIFRRGE